MRQKPKYSYIDWVLFTQLHEIFESPVGSRQRVEELADLINVAIEHIEDSGYNPVAVFAARCGKDGVKGKHALGIAHEYYSAWSKIGQELVRRRGK